jgi:hypothetical protein
MAADHQLPAQPEDSHPLLSTLIQLRTLLAGRLLGME